MILESYDEAYARAVKYVMTQRRWKDGIASKALGITGARFIRVRTALIEAGYMRKYNDQFGRRKIFPYRKG